MQFLGILVLALTPGIFWLWLIYRWDKYQPEPRLLVIRTFLLGMVVVIPVALLEVVLALPYLLPDITNLSIESISKLSIGGVAYFSFIVAGFSEELGKYLVVRGTIYRSVYFNEPADGILYASAVALGFASLENVGYLAIYGWENILVRGPISTLAHVLFSMVWGYPLALRKVGWRRGRLLVWLGLLGSMIAHGLFDFLAFSQNNISMLVIPFFVIMAVLMVLIMRHARKISPFKDKVTELQMTCPQCGNTIPFYASFCPVCGLKLAVHKEQVHLICGKCGATLESSANYCTTCGSRLVRQHWRK
jgi:RsiW-degrading membrane proteinase PrsW (M82 family)/ribosomal protein L40E